MPDLEREYAFISYAQENLEQALKVYEGLKKRKVNVWIDKKNLEVGKWKSQIFKAISRSNYFVFCLSNAALKKMSGEQPGFQDEELQTAWEFAREQDEKGFTIIPVRLEDCGRGDMRLSIWQQYDLFKDWEGILDTLAVNLGGISLSVAMAIDERTDDEKTVESIMGKVEMWYYAGEYDKALSLLETAMEFKPDNPKVWSNKGVLLAILGRKEEALEAYNKAIDNKPNKYEVCWHNKGNLLVTLGRNEEALEAYNKAIDSKPDMHETWHNKGHLLATLGRNDEALEAYNNAIDIKPDKYEAWLNKGFLLATLGRNEEAREAFEKAKEIQKKYNK